MTLSVLNLMEGRSVVDSRSTFRASYGSVPGQWKTQYLSSYSAEKSCF